MKKIISLCLLIICSGPLLAQQFGLYNSRTLYDVFENPSQSAFQIDTSRRVAFNFFIPTLTFNGTASGSASPALKTLIYKGVVKADNIPLSGNEYSTIIVNSNTYIAMLRLLKTVKKSQELGISWQIRNDGRIKAPNETLAIFDDYRLFAEGSFDGIFNAKGYNQSYHQFSISYRQDPSKRLSVGVKGSLLSGITYNSFKIVRSNLLVDHDNETIDVTVAGQLRSSAKFDKFDSEAVKPFFKNPGLSFTAGVSYKLRNGWFVMGTLKDLGFIKWNKSSYEYNVDVRNITITDASDPSADNRLADELDKQIKMSSANRSYYSIVNGKAEILFNKNYGDYRPNLILSKSLYYDGGDIALVNNYHYRNLVFTASADYNTSKYLAIGAQFMVKSANTEFFIGSAHVLKTLEAIDDAGTSTPPYSSGYAGASFYMGFGLKFGRVLEHPANANYIPGMEESSGGGFLKRLFKKKD